MWRSKFCKVLSKKCIGTIPPFLRFGTVSISIKLGHGWKSKKSIQKQWAIHRRLLEQLKPHLIDSRLDFCIDERIPHTGYVENDHTYLFSMTLGKNIEECDASTKLIIPLLKYATRGADTYNGPVVELMTLLQDEMAKDEKFFAEIILNWFNRKAIATFADKSEQEENFLQIEFDIYVREIIEVLKKVFK